MTAVTFDSTYAQFVSELKGTFPEFAAALSSVPEGAKAHFVSTWKPHTAAVASQTAGIFAGSGVELVPGVRMTATLWAELSAKTQAAIWKYLSSLLLLAASADETLWDLSGFAHDMEELMKRLKEEGGGETPTMMKDMFEKLGKMAETFGFDAKDLSGAAAAAGKFKIPERLFKGHIAKIAEELVKEFKPEDFGISPELLTSDDPARVFTYLQEVFTKKPELLMSAAQKIAKRLQAKFQNGSIKREEIIREAEELMAEFSENEAFSSMFGSLGEMLKGSEKEAGQDGSARLRETRERMKKKQAEKEARRAATSASTSPATSAEANLIFNTRTSAAAAAEAALLLEAAAEDAAKRTKPTKKR
jgi:hypothetical protein